MNNIFSVPRSCDYCSKFCRVVSLVLLDAFVSLLLTATWLFLPPQVEPSTLIHCYCDFQQDFNTFTPPRWGCDHPHASLSDLSQYLYNCDSPSVFKHLMKLSQLQIFIFYIYPDLFQEVLRQGTWIRDVQWDTIYFFNEKIEEEKWGLKDNGEKRV